MKSVYTFEEGYSVMQQSWSQVRLISSLTQLQSFSNFAKPATLKNCTEKRIKDQAYLANQAY